MKQTFLPFTLRPFVLACGICLASAPAFASSAPRATTPGLSTLIFQQESNPEQTLCPTSDASPPVLARVTSALTVAALHQAEPGFVLIDDVEPAPTAVPAGPNMEVAAAAAAAVASRANDWEVLVSASQGSATPPGKPGNLARLAEMPREWAEKAKALSAHISAKFKVDESYASKVVNSVISAGRQTGLSPNLLLAVIAEESRFQASARNGNARGLMQIIPFWHKKKVNEVGGPQELMKSDKNIAVGSAILKDYVDRSESIFQALTKYNASPRASEYSARVLKQQKGFDAIFAPAPK